MKILTTLLFVFVVSSFLTSLSAQEVSFEDSLYCNLDSLYELKNDLSIESEELRKELSITYENALEYLFYYNDMTSTELAKFRNLFEQTEKAINMEGISEDEALEKLYEISIYDKYVRLPEFYKRFIALKEKVGLTDG
jgi:hypothetical protein